MAFQEISTGYKPEFTLGGLYHGFNAANAEDLNKEELIKQFLANQHAQVQNPLDEQTSAQNLLINQHKADPRYGAAQIGIQEGQRDTQTAAGKLKQALLPQEITTGKQELAHKEAIGTLLSRLDEMKRGGGGTGQVGFPMQPQQQSPTEQTTSGFSWQIPPKVQASRDESRRQILQQELAMYPDDVNVRKELAAMGQPQAVNANNSPLVQQPPQRNGGLTQGSPEYEAVMQALVDQPELRAKLLLGDQKLDSSEYNMMMKLIAQRDLAAGKVKPPSDPKTAQETMQRILAKQRRGETLTPDDVDTYNQANATFNALIATKIQPGPMVNPGIAPDVLQSKPTTPQSPSLSLPGQASVAPKAPTVIKYDAQGNRVQ
jgi:hypothetical protein